MGTALFTSAKASSLMARALAFEQPAFRNLSIDNDDSSCGFSFPSHKSSTRLMMVAAAFVESCCESIEEAKVAKLLALRFVLELSDPMGHIPASFITASNLGFKSTIRLAIWRFEIAGRGLLM